MSAGNRKIAIVGWAFTSRDKAPYDDPEWEIWAINEAHRFTWLKRWDRWFQLHPDWIFSREKNHIDPKHHAWLQRQPGPGQDGYKPIMMQESYADIPASMKYPLGEVFTFLGRRDAWERFAADGNAGGRGFPLTSTVSEMFALALYEGATSVGFWGVEMATNTEWRYQREGFAWLAGFAEARGVSIVFPENCTLLRGKIYGWEAVPMIGRQELELYYGKLRKDEQEALAQLNCRLGSFQDLSDLTQKKQNAGEEPDADMVKRLRELENEIKMHQQIVNQMVGGRMVVTDLIHRIDMQEPSSEGRVGSAYLGGGPVEDEMLKALSDDPRMSDFGEVVDESA